VKANTSKRTLSDRLETLEWKLFQLILVLLAGGFVVIAGLLGIIAELLR
jgi:hypothetical protein